MTDRLKKPSERIEQRARELKSSCYNGASAGGVTVLAILEFLDAHAHVFETRPVDAAGREDAGLPRADEPMETLSADELEAIEEGRHPWTVDELLSRMEYDEDYSDMATLRGAIGKERAQRAEEIARLKERSAALETELIQSEADCGATLAESDDKLQEMLSERDAATARAEKAESRVRDNQAEIDRLALSRRLAAQTLRDLAPAQNNGLKTLEQHVDDASSYITSLQSEVTRLTAALKESESRVVFLGGQLNSKPCAANLPVAIPESGEGQ